LIVRFHVPTTTPSSTTVGRKIPLPPGIDHLHLFGGHHRRAVAVAQHVLVDPRQQQHLAVPLRLLDRPTDIRRRERGPSAELLAKRRAVAVEVANGELWADAGGTVLRREPQQVIGVLRVLHHTDVFEDPCAFGTCDRPTARERFTQHVDGGDGTGRVLRTCRCTVASCTAAASSVFEREPIDHPPLHSSWECSAPRWVTTSRAEASGRDVTFRSFCEDGQVRHTGRT